MGELGILIKNAKIFHFGSLSMTAEPVRTATEYALKVAKENHVLISFDPNLREPLWKDLEEARTQIDHGMRYCDVLKISDNEILWFTGESNYDMAAEKLRS